MEWSGCGEPWRPISRWAIGGWLVFYLLFLAYVFEMRGGYLFIDSANLVVHEGGHLLFGWFGSTLGIWGGTILQWLVPLLLAGYFFYDRQSAAFALCMILFFENWLYTATYMADARAMALPLVTTGDPEFVEHDWHTIFLSMGVLQYDTAIAGVVRGLGWIGMVACVAWLMARGARPNLSSTELDFRATLRSPTSPGFGADPRRNLAAPRCDTPATAAERSRESAAVLPERGARR